MKEYTRQFLIGLDTLVMTDIALIIWNIQCDNYIGFFAGIIGFFIMGLCWRKR
jgi:hypothetical protein